MPALKLDGTFLRSKVARRVFTVFLMSALVPILLTGILSLRGVDALVEEQGREQLKYASRAYASTLYERLLLADAAMAQLAESLAAHGRSPVRMQSGSLQFGALTVHAASGARAALLGELLDPPVLDADAARHLTSGKALLWVDNEAGRAPKLLMIRALGASTQAGDRLVGELRADYLWGDPESFPHLTDICVLARQGALLYCSKPLPEQVALQLSADTPASFAPTTRWEADQTSYLASYWKLFLLPKFHAASWTVVASKPEAHAVEASAAFHRFYLPIVLGSVLLVALVAASQVRRMLVPLETLIDATRRVSKEDFGKPVTIERADEFGELAVSFNAMTERLRRQFGALVALSGLDRLILSKPDVARVAELTLARVAELVAFERAVFVTVDEGAAPVARAFVQTRTNGAVLQSQQWMLGADETAWLRSRSRGVWLDPARSRILLPPCARLADSHPVYTIAIVYRGGLLGYIAVACDREDAIDESTAQELHGLADRVAVAISTWARDRELHQQAHFDSLTGLPNRPMLLHTLGRMLKRARRNDDRLALLFVDLDRFKTINDTLGHTIGDMLLVQAAARLKSTVREIDMVARLGGDEFTVVLPQIATPSEAAALAERLIDALSAPFLLQGYERFIGASVGLSIYPQDGASADDLLRSADTALTHAKEAGGGRCVRFEQRMDAEAARRAALEAELRHALERDELVLHYQPQIDVGHGTVIGVEALVRWAHPLRGLVGPNEFITLAEQTGLIEPLGQWVLQEACKQMKAWQVAGIAPARIAVNVSIHQLERADFVQTVQAVIRDTGLLPADLELEVTESVFLDRSGHGARALEQLHRAGLVIALDDFGTGYSSMARLKSLPVDILKIDRSFIDGAPGDEDASAIVAAIVAMAHRLRKKVVAEGVETQAQLDFLTRQGCEIAQGYWLSRPLTAHAFAQFMQRQQVSA